MDLDSQNILRQEHFVNTWFVANMSARPRGSRGTNKYPRADVGKTRISPNKEQQQIVADGNVSSRVLEAIHIVDLDDCAQTVVCRC